MKATFQKPTTQIPETFHNEPTKESLDQDPSNWKPKTIALAALGTLGASYLTYQYSFPKIHIPDSPVSSPMSTAFKVVASLAALATLAKLIPSTDSTNHLKEHKSSNKYSDTKVSKKPIPKAISGEVNIDLISSKNKNPQTILDINQDTSFDEQEPTNPYIEKLFNEFHAEEKINKDLLETLITTYNHLCTTLSEETISNELFISKITPIILEFQTSFWKHSSSLDEKKSNFNKIIDTLDVFTGRSDYLSCEVVEQLFADHVIPNGLHHMTQVFVGEQDTGSKKLVEHSCQLVYKALVQQMKIFFTDGIYHKEKNTADKAFNQILDLLTPFEKDDFRLSPNFYANFIQYSSKHNSSKHAWKIVQKYIFESVINKKTLTYLKFHSDYIIASILNARECKDEVEFYEPHSSNEGWDILNNIIIAVKLSLFSDLDEGAASFAIRLMQHKLNINPKRFEKNYPNDYELLKKLYSELCTTKNLNLQKNFANENKLSKDATLIATGLINERRTSFLANHLLGTDVTQYRQSLINKIAPLMLIKEKEYSDGEKNAVQVLSKFIESQILDPSIPQRAELATLALKKYPELFHNTQSIKLIRDAYLEVRDVEFSEKTELDLACENFLNNWDALSELNSQIKTQIENPESIDKRKIKELPNNRFGTPIK